MRGAGTTSKSAELNTPLNAETPTPKPTTTPEDDEKYKRGGFSILS